MNKSNKILLIILVVLLVVFMGNKYFGDSGSRNFKTTLVALDTAVVDKIVLIGKTNDYRPLTITRQGNNWQVSDDNLQDEADKTAVKGMLNELVNISPDRLLATSEDLWPENEVTDSLATRVQVFTGDKLQADFYVGKFNFQAASRKMSTSVRLAGDAEVYAVEGFLSSVFNRSVDDLRDKTFIKAETDNITSIAFTYPGDSSYTLNKALQGWAIAGKPTDSTVVKTYLNGLQSLRPRKFVNNFAVDGKTPAYSLNIALNDGTGITVSAYAGGDGMILHSSLNADAWFTDEGIKIYERLFVPQEHLLLTSEK